MFVHLSLNTCECVEITNQLPFKSMLQTQTNLCHQLCGHHIHLRTHSVIVSLLSFFSAAFICHSVLFSIKGRASLSHSQRACLIFHPVSCIKKEGTYKLEHVWLSLQHHVTHSERHKEGVGEGTEVKPFCTQNVSLFCEKTNSAFLLFSVTVSWFKI